MPLQKGRYGARLAQGEQDVQAAKRLRQIAFRGAGPGSGAQDGDRFDAECIHVLVEEAATGALVCTFRMMTFQTGAEIARSYAAQFYDLSGLTGFDGPMVEIGRFCVAPGVDDVDVLRIAWGAITAYVDAHGVKLLFGCSSFAGVSEEVHLDAFSVLRERHLAPKRWLPRIKAPQVFPFAARLGARKPDLRAGMKAMPPLLRTYLAMGGWVSDHAVIDRDLGTLHVFTGVEIAAIPPSRAKALRAVMG